MFHAVEFYFYNILEMGRKHKDGEHMHGCQVECVCDRAEDTNTKR